MCILIPISNTLYATTKRKEILYKLAGKTVQTALLSSDVVWTVGPSQRRPDGQVW